MSKVIYVVLSIEIPEGKDIDTVIQTADYNISLSNEKLTSQVCDIFEIYPFD